MVRGIFVIFLTLVVSGTEVIASPHLDSPPAKEQDESYKPPPQFAIDNLTITPTEKPKGLAEMAQRFSKKDFYYAYKQSVHVFGGSILPVTDSTDDEDLMHLMLGASYEFESRTSPKWEVEAIWTSFSLGGLSAVRKRIFNEKGSFRPFYKYGVTYKVVPEEKLSSAANFENFMFRTGIGFADMIKPPKSMRFDVDLAVGVEDLWVMAYFGYAWGW